MTDDYPTIPQSVLNLLRHRWILPSEFVAYDDAKNREDRWTRPVWRAFFMKQDPDEPQGFAHYTAAEIAALMVDGVYGPHAHQRPGGRMIVNEHAQNAVEGFCGEVYAAWEKCQRRLAEIPLVQPPAGKGGDHG